MQELRQSTEMKVRMGSAVDATDGVSPETGLTLGTADQAELLKHNGAATVDISAATFAAITAVDGWYDLTLTTAHTDTLGQLTVVIQDSSLMAPIFRDFMVVTANYWDSKYSADVLQVDVTEWLGSTVTANVAGQPTVDVTRIDASTQSLVDLKDFADEGYDPVTNKVQGVVLVDTTTTNTDLVSAADVVNEWETQSQADPTGFHVNVLEIGGTAQTANDNGADINAILADTDELQTDWVNGGRLDLILDIIAADTTTDIPALIAALNNISTAQVNTEVDTALSDINLDHLVKSAVDTNFASTVHLDSVVGQMVDVGTSATFDRTTDSNEAIRNKQTDMETDIDAILVDTNEIGTAGAGLTDLGGMSTSMKAEIESEANDALVAQKLDHLVAVSDSDDPVNDSIIAKLAASDGDWSGYDKTTDSQEAIRNRGDTSWVTGAGGSDRLLMVDTTIATLASQTSFTLTAGSADDDAYNNCTIVIEDSATSTQKAVGLVSAYTGATKTVTLKYDPGIFTMAPTDKVYILAENALKATLANRQLNVAADGDIAGNVDGSVASVVGAIGSVTGAVGSVTGNVGGNVIGSTGSVVGAVGSVTGNVGGNVAGSVGSVTGAVGSVTGGVGGNVTGSVGSVVGHTAQTGDTFSLANGASGFVNIIADTNELQTDWVNGGRLDLILDGVKVKTDNLPDGIKKNTAITAFTFLMVDSTDHVTAKTGLTVAGNYSADGGAIAALTNTGAITEISNGLYEIDLTAGELNYEHVTLIFTAAGADTRVITIHTST